MSGETVRVLIVDDERLARRELRRLLRELPEVEVLGEAGDGPSARALIEELQPDLVLLDVKMPGESGFDLLERLERVPHVVFTTAYDQFALRAFEVNALDYLVKPIEAERLAVAIGRVASRLAASRAESPRTDPAGSRLGLADRVFLKDGERCWFVAVREIVLFESAGNATRVLFADQSPTIPRTLAYLEERLDPQAFFRANRSQIIGLSHLRRIEPWFGDRLLVELRGGHRIELSRRRAQALRRLGF